MVDPGVADHGQGRARDRGQLGTGENAATGEPTWGKTGTTDDNGDAWFCGATEEITACVWVGHADTVTPMETEFAGAPVDGGTFPALIFADVVNAYEEIQAAHEAGEEPDDDSSTSSTTEPSEPAAPTYEEPAPAPAEAPAPDDGGATDAAAPSSEAPTGGAPASSGGGIAPG